MRPIRFNFPAHTKAELIIDAYTDKEKAYEIKGVNTSKPYVTIKNKRVYLEHDEVELVKTTIKK